MNNDLSDDSRRTEILDIRYIKGGISDEQK
jgi:uncharacterized membrane protein